MDKIQQFKMDLLWVGIHGGQCLECFVEKYEHGHKSYNTINQCQKVAVVAALQRAGFSIEEIRAMKFVRPAGRIGTPIDLSKEEIETGEWTMCGCMTSQYLVRKVEERCAKQ
ncbi:hypothetical protein A3C17_01905 [Candidatus Uhrbacteria bacterium RIFCSPHIGHO2_02_FULL_53_13]|nr:MAG: hypothetical protein A3C17_01905 [Candidatus Uhrbacteria bacterium RIFCSPHIGHO2_02_FULL_53_13]